MTSPLAHLNAPDCDEEDFEAPVGNLYSYFDGERWVDGLATGVRPKSDLDETATVQIDHRDWYPVSDLRESGHYTAVLVNPDGTIYRESIESLAEGEPALVIRDIGTYGADNLRRRIHPRRKRAWEPGGRVLYRYVGSADLGPSSES